MIVMCKTFAAPCKLCSKAMGPSAGGAGAVEPADTKRRFVIKKRKAAACAAFGDEIYSGSGQDVYSSRSYLKTLFGRISSGQSCRGRGGVLHGGILHGGVLHVGVPSRKTPKRGLTDGRDFGTKNEGGRCAECGREIVSGAFLSRFKQEDLDARPSGAGQNFGVTDKKPASRENDAGKQKKYKYLMFDADDTLLDFKMAEHAALKTVLKDNGLPEDDGTVELYSTINLKYWKMYERGEIERDDIFPLRFTEFLKSIGSPLPPMEINEQYFRQLRLGYYLLPGAKEMLDYAAGYYKLYIITNGVAVTQRSRLRGSGIDRYFSDIFISEELGCQKPSVRFFEKALKGMGNPKKSDCLIIGDSLTGDIQGGKNIGIDTCHVNVRGAVNNTGIKPDYEITALPQLLDII